MARYKFYIVLYCIVLYCKSRFSYDDLSIGNYHLNLIWLLLCPRVDILTSGHILECRTDHHASFVI